MRSEDRLREWKEFRHQIDKLPFERAVIQTTHLWSYAPFVNHYLDKIPPNDWPGPWDLLNENRYDDTAKALGMLYTLVLSEHGKNHEFAFVKAQASSGLESYNLVYIDKGKYILNFTFDEVISKQQLEKEAPAVCIMFETNLPISQYQ